MLPEELLPEAYIGTILHDESLFNPLDRVPVQLLLILSLLLLL